MGGTSSENYCYFKVHDQERQYKQIDDKDWFTMLLLNALITFTETNQNPAIQLKSEAIITN